MQHKMLFEEQELTVLESLQLGTTKMRLVQSPSGKSTYMQMWSSLSSCWRTTYRYNVQENWEAWKKYATVHYEGKNDGGNTATSPKPKRKRKVAGVKPELDASANSTKNRKRNRKPTVKN